MGYTEVSPTHAPQLRATAVRKIHIFRSATLTKATCDRVEASFTPFPGAETLQRLLDQKEQRVRTYRKCCDDLWLLIVSDGRTLARTIDVEQVPQDHEYQSTFDRVFLFAEMSHIRELKIRRV